MDQVTIDNTLKDISNVFAGISNIATAVFNPSGTGNSVNPMLQAPGSTGTAANNPPLVNIGATVGLSAETKNYLVVGGIILAGILLALLIKR